MTSWHGSRFVSASCGIATLPRNADEFTPHRVPKDVSPKNTRVCRLPLRSSPLRRRIGLGKSPYWPSTVMQKVIKTAARGAGILKHIGWHMFQRTTATWLLANGGPSARTSALLRLISLHSWNWRAATWKWSRQFNRPLWSLGWTRISYFSPLSS